MGRKLRYRYEQPRPVHPTERWYTCRRKRTYPDEATAADAVTVAEWDGLRLRAYHCPHCGGWHLARRQSP